MPLLMLAPLPGTPRYPLPPFTLTFELGWTSVLSLYFQSTIHTSSNTQAVGLAIVIQSTSFEVKGLGF